MYRAEGHYSVCSWGQEPSEGLPGLRCTGRHVQKLTHLEDETCHKGLLARQTPPCIYALDILFVWVLSQSSPTDSGLRQPREPFWGCFWPDWWQSVTNTYVEPWNHYSQHVTQQRGGCSWFLQTEVSGRCWCRLQGQLQGGCQHHLSCKSSLPHPPLLLPHTLCHPHKDVLLWRRPRSTSTITSAPLTEHICFHFRALFHLLLISVKRGFLENYSSKCDAYVFLITNNMFLFFLTGMFSLFPVVLCLYHL